MSWMPGATADQDLNCPDQVEMTIIPRTGDIGDFEIMRALPFRNKRMVGPFIFWDQMGPGEFLTGKGVDVRPHPHIGLSTVTYLLDGSLDHKDSLGTSSRILPGEINLMSAGKGIVHSERTGEDIRKIPSKLFGIQSWLAQPKSLEESEPSFQNHKEEDLPFYNDKNTQIKLIMGDFHGLKSPVKTDWETLYAEVMLDKGTSFEIPASTEERAIYTLKGEIEISQTKYNPNQMMVLAPGKQVIIKANENVHMMILGGAAMDGPRHIWWNFVASDKEKIKQAQEDWKNNKFPAVPNDADEFIPLPNNLNFK